MSNAEEETMYIIGDKKNRFGFQVGATVDYRLSKSFYLQSGLSLTTKGTIHEDAELWIGGPNAPVTYSKTATRLTYLQLPLKIGYQFHLSPRTALFIQAGPYVAYGIGGKEITERRTVNPSGEPIPDEKITGDSFGDRTTPSNGLKREDFGLSGGIGARYRKLSLSVEYEPGLSNIGGQSESESFSEQRTYRNRNLALVLGYNF